MAIDMQKYMDAYITETEEHLQNLNDSLLQLEKNPNDIDAINQIFRSAHTLKSSSAAMGFQKISELAHSMEDVLGRIKDKEINANANIVDVMFKCFDTLEVMIGKVTKGEKEQGNTEPLLKKLNVIMEMKVSVGNQELSDKKVRRFSKETKKSEGLLSPETSEAKASVKEEINDTTTVDETTAAEIKDGDKDEEVFQEAADGAELAEKPHTLKTVRFVKVGMDKLDKLMNLVGELLINKMQLQQIKQETNIKELNEPINHLDRLTTDLQFEITQARLVPIGQIFNRFPRMVRDLAKQENKNINLILEGSDMELDRTVIDEIGEPLVHLLRNAVDHGLESVDDRKAANKKEQGTIILRAKRDKNIAVIEVQDDGSGIDIEKIRKTAIERKLITQQQANTLSSSKIMQLIFDPRFSTAKKVTEISGRGVGLDVVKNKIEKLNGSVNIESLVGKGTQFRVELPLTLAIIQCFLVKVNTEHYAIPLSNVIRTVRIEATKIRPIEGNETFILDEEDIPLIRLTSVFNLQHTEKESYTVVIVERGGEQAGLVVDTILGKQEIIIKPLDRSLKDTEGVSGCTILGDGSVALILDLKTLL